MRILLLCSLTVCLSALAQEPPQSPDEADWKFVDVLSAPMTWHPHWTRDTVAHGEVSLARGVQVAAQFPDETGTLETAYEDLGNFFAAVDIPTDGPFRIITERVSNLGTEAFTLVVSEAECRIQARDTEGIRRAIYFLEDELLRADGPFLAIGETTRSPFVKTRISRCFFGPIKRPPMNRDELLNDVDYYPDEYLNRLAHDGVNALWLTVEFKDICKNSLIPNASPDRDRRLEKLRKTVAKCRRYGIDVFLFTMEPYFMPYGHPLLLAYPEIGGATRGKTDKLFCPFSEAAQTYLQSSLHSIFSVVPDLGGLINISYGEVPTICLSSADDDWNIDCPTCTNKEPWEIHNASVSAMERGMREAAPDAKFISWLYTDPRPGPGFKPLLDIARKAPPGVIVQYNFESGGSKMQLGKARRANDYWLSYVGPSDAFRTIANTLRDEPVELSAKTQTSNSHEVASVPFIPVPGQLYGKYSAMRGLGVNTVMQCWYFGNLPSMMNRAASSALPFSPEDITEDEFLQDLARRDWAAEDVPKVVEAWRLFADAYDNYPLTNAFQFYGPVTDGLVWPLHLKPVQLPLGPTWRVDYPISADRIGECFSGTHTYPEVLELCRTLSDTWSRGLEVLRALEPNYLEEPERLMDISVAQALGLQFRSSYNILRFYDLREQLLYGPVETHENILQALRDIVEEEIANAQAMSALCDANPFLGFHSEAEAYKYFPAKLQWRANLLRTLLDTEFAEAERAVAAGERVFSARSGMGGESLAYAGSSAPESFSTAWREDTSWKKVDAVQAHFAPHEPDATWQLLWDSEALYVNVRRARTEDAGALSAVLHLQASHIYPRRTFALDEQGNQNTRLAWQDTGGDWEGESTTSNGHTGFRFRIPFAVFDGELDRDNYPTRPLRINLQILSTPVGAPTPPLQNWAPPGATNPAIQTWAPVSETPPRYRLGFGGEDPSEMGWLHLAP